MTSVPAAHLAEQVQDCGDTQVAAQHSQWHCALPVAARKRVGQPRDFQPADFRTSRHSTNRDGNGCHVIVHQWAHSIFLSTLCASGLRSSHGVALVMGCPALVVKEGPCCCCCCWGCCCCPKGTSCPCAGCAPKVDWPPKGDGAALLLGAPQLKPAPVDCGALPAAGDAEVGGHVESGCSGRALRPRYPACKEGAAAGRIWLEVPSPACIRGTERQAARHA